VGWRWRGTKHTHAGFHHHVKLATNRRENRLVIYLVAIGVCAEGEPQSFGVDYGEGVVGSAGDWHCKYVGAMPAEIPQSAVRGLKANNRRLWEGLRIFIQVQGLSIRVKGVGVGFRVKGLGVGFRVEGIDIYLAHAVSPFPVIHHEIKMLPLPRLRLPPPPPPLHSVATWLKHELLL
jgi:hypothetical protein